MTVYHGVMGLIHPPVLHFLPAVGTCEFTVCTMLSVSVWYLCMHLYDIFVCMCACMCV